MTETTAKQYGSAEDFIATYGGLDDPAARILNWRTDEWSDRAVALAVLMIQRNTWHERPRDHRASERNISAALGYKNRTPLVGRALKRLTAAGWLRVVGPTGQGHYHTYEFWMGEGTPPTPADEGDDERRPGSMGDTEAEARTELDAMRPEAAPPTEQPPVLVDDW